MVHLSGMAIPIERIDKTRNRTFPDLIYLEKKINDNKKSAKLIQVEFTIKP